MSDLQVLSLIGLMFFIFGILIWCYQSKKQVERRSEEMRDRLRGALDKHER